MAGGRSNMMFVGVIVATLMVAGAVALVHAGEEVCPRGYAYAFQTYSCFEPAQYSVEYHLVAPFSINSTGAIGGLEPEFGTNFIRFTGDKSDEGAKYAVTKLQSNADPNIGLGILVKLTNTETKKPLAWRKPSAASNQLLLVEANAGSGSVFVLKLAPNVDLPCPKIANARCEAYYFDSSAGSFLAVSGSGVTYVTADPAGSKGNLPLLLRRVKVDRIRPVVA